MLFLSHQLCVFKSKLLSTRIKNKLKKNKQTHKAQNTKTINMQMNKTTTTNNKQRKNNQNKTNKKCFRRF